VVRLGAVIPGEARLSHAQSQRFWMNCVAKPRGSSAALRSLKLPQVALRSGAPLIDFVGLPKVAVQVSRECITNAAPNSGFCWPSCQHDQSRALPVVLEVACGVSALLTVIAVKRSSLHFECGFLQNDFAARGQVVDSDPYPR
jgi:hypothetical protein